MDYVISVLNLKTRALPVALLLFYKVTLLWLLIAKMCCDKREV